MEPLDSQNTIASAPLNFGRWYASWIMGVCAVWTVFYYLVFHLLLHIPNSPLYWPAAIHTTASILVGPIAFKAVTKFRSSSGRDVGMFYAAAALMMLCTATCWIYFGLRAGVLPRDQAGALYSIIVPGSVLAPLAALYIRKRSYRSAAGGA